MSTEVNNLAKKPTKKPTNWKKRYQNLKATKKQSLIGQITGLVNRVGRQAPTMIANVATAVVAATPLVASVMYHVPRGEIIQLRNAINRDYNPIDSTQPFWINKQALPQILGPIGIQLGKKGVQKIGSMF